MENPWKSISIHHWSCPTEIHGISRFGGYGFYRFLLFFLAPWHPPHMACPARTACASSSSHRHLGLKNAGVATSQVCQGGPLPALTLVVGTNWPFWNPTAKTYSIYIYIQTLVLTFIYLFSSLGLVLFMISCWYIMCLSQNQICPCRCGKPHATYLFCWGMLGGCLLDAPSGEIGHQMGYGSFRSLPHDHRTKRTMKMVESYVSSCLLFAGSFTVCWW